MSGPKDYAPPPSYSIQVFDGKLNEVFQLQSRLKQMIEELKNSNIEDNEMHINFDCQEALRAIEKQVNDALKRLQFNYRGSFGQDIYNKILNEINTRIIELKSLNEKCNTILQDFLIKETDYNSYLMYHQYFERSMSSFNNFKESVEAYLKNNTPLDANSIFSETKKTLDAIVFELREAPFEFGFNAKSEALTNLVVSEIFEKEKGVNDARMDFNNQIIERYPSAKLKTKSKIFLTYTSFIVFSYNFNIRQQILVAIIQYHCVLGYTIIIQIHILILIDLIQLIICCLLILQLFLI